MLAEVESALVTRLQQVLGNHEIVITDFPGNWEDQARAARQARIFVGYKRSRFNKGAGEPIVLETTAEFDVLLMVKDIRTHATAYPLLDRIKVALTGFYPSADNVCGKCYPLSEGFVKFEEGIWYYLSTWAVPLLWCEDTVSLYPEPLPITEIKSGIYRAHVDDLTDAVLDRNLTISIE